MSLASNPAQMQSPAPRRRDDYRLIGGAAERAAAARLVNAQWYKCPVPRPVMKGLMQRDDAHALRDTALWYALIIGSGALFAYGWTAGWGAVALFAAYFVYATLYCGPADSRWHESSHGTAFKTRWINDVLYQCASFQVLRRPTRWRWSHARHHTDTLVTGRDPEIAAPVPVDWASTLLNLFAILNGPKEMVAVLRNACGSISAEEKTFVPEMEWPRMVREARLWVLVYAVVMGSALALQSWLPVLLIGLLPGMLGAWLYNFFGLTQHAGMPENVLDHRLNCRTVYMNPLFRFLYWNMNYHVEHHMFPMVPYHQLPRLHEAIQADCPPPYASTIAAYAEILPTMWRQAKDPYHCVRRTLPAQAA
ncbi:fatty acid desaturase family protein [Rhodoferax sp. GW822-FHT02A01]|uniref:fatty acid desaturase family protein n=1 Tax=Rhodoferax sp. GW822-FHT02A01 TaxID=3141537 RepID=UPI00315DB633